MYAAACVCECACVYVCGNSCSFPCFRLAAQQSSKLANWKRCEFISFHFVTLFRAWCISKQLNCDVDCKADWDADCDVCHSALISFNFNLKINFPPGPGLGPARCRLSVVAVSCCCFRCWYQLLLLLLLPAVCAVVLRAANRKSTRQTVAAAACAADNFCANYYRQRILRCLCCSIPLPPNPRTSVPHPFLDLCFSSLSLSACPSHFLSFQLSLPISHFICHFICGIWLKLLALAAKCSWDLASFPCLPPPYLLAPPPKQSQCASFTATSLEV